MIRHGGGTPEQFYDLFEITAKQLKKQFPQLKIGGSALAHDTEWWMLSCGRCSAASDDKDIYVAAAKDEAGNQAVLLCHYTDDDTVTEAKSVKLELNCGTNSYDVYLLDATTDAIRTACFTGGSFTLAPNTVVMLKSHETDKGENYYE